MPACPAFGHWESGAVSSAECLPGAVWGRRGSNVYPIVLTCRSPGEDPSFPGIGKSRISLSGNNFLTSLNLPTRVAPRLRVIFCMVGGRNDMLVFHPQEKTRCAIFLVNSSEMLTRLGSWQRAAARTRALSSAWRSSGMSSHRLMTGAGTGSAILTCCALLAEEALMRW